ncbi:carboxypeptidase-like regulatory domain-containing protein [candidate division KSB1 bacterium]
MINRKKYLILSILLSVVFFSSLLFYKTSIAQQNIVDVKGQIIDADSKIPLDSALVFLANTTYGTITDSDGKFVLKNIPLRSYEMVIARSSYDILKKEVYILSEENIEVSFKLTPRNEIKLKNDKKNRNKNLKTFNEAFLGKYFHSDKCEITNPEDIYYLEGKNKSLETYSNNLIRVDFGILRDLL